MLPACPTWASDATVRHGASVQTRIPRNHKRLGIAAASMLLRKKSEDTCLHGRFIRSVATARINLCRNSYHIVKDVTNVYERLCLNGCLKLAHFSYLLLQPSANGLV